MKKITKKWLPYIEADLNLAEAGLKGKRANKWTCLLIIWHCQQAVEKSLKMYSIENGKELLLTHDLPRLLRYSDLKDEKIIANLLLNSTNIMLSHVILMHHCELIIQPLVYK